MPIYTYRCPLCRKGPETRVVEFSERDEQMCGRVTESFEDTIWSEENGKLKAAHTSICHDRCRGRLVRDEIELTHRSASWG